MGNVRKFHFQLIFFKNFYLKTNCINSFYDTNAHSSKMKEKMIVKFPEDVFDCLKSSRYQGHQLIHLFQCVLYLLICIIQCLSSNNTATVDGADCT